MAELSLEDARTMIDAQRQEIEALRKERDELKVRLGDGDSDAQVEAYLKEKYEREKQQREKQQALKNDLV